MVNAISFRRDLLRWYGRHKRDLPWRNSTDPYRVWISEIMLQQTRVSAVIPYYERFLQRFPDAEALAAAPEQDLLAAWAGLGYYSRARNLQKAARLIVGNGGFPADHRAIRELPGIGEYTAAAVGSIAFGIRQAAVDGNVIRVLSRISAEAGEVQSQPVRSRLRVLANQLLDPKRPGDFNQAMMELGATLCLPARPRCVVCPMAAQCEARQAGRQEQFPVKQKKSAAEQVSERILLIRRGAKYLFWQRTAGSRRMAGFWELPAAAQLPQARMVKRLGEFRHTIVNTNYRFEVMEAKAGRIAKEFCWFTPSEIAELPLSTTAKKALALLP